MTTDSLSLELTFDERRGVILQRITRSTLLLHVINHYTILAVFNNFAIRRPYLLSKAPHIIARPPKAENVATPMAD